MEATGGGKEGEETTDQPQTDDQSTNNTEEQSRCPLTPEESAADLKDDGILKKRPQKQEEKPAEKRTQSSEEQSPVPDNSKRKKKKNEQPSGSNRNKKGKAGSLRGKKNEANSNRGSSRASKPKVINSNEIMAKLKMSPNSPKPPPAEDEREKLKENEIVCGGPGKMKWKVLKLLGSGGFGDVYRVTTDGKKEYAMKTEMNVGDKRILRLKVEVVALQVCHQAKKSHFVEMADRGQTDKFKYVVMSLVGPSLEDIRWKYLNTRYSIKTCMNIASQTLEAIKDLHELGWIHRDIKPANFAVGLGDDETTIYMLDFGIAKKVFLGNTKTMKKPRVKVKFLGTQRYASRNCHLLREQGRQDDLETWIYMIVDLADDQDGLPWKKTDPKERSKLPEIKKKFMRLELDEPFKRLPFEFKRIVQYVDGLKYETTPDYYYMEETLQRIMTQLTTGIFHSKSKQLDWVGKLQSKEELKKTEVSADMKLSGSVESTENSERLKGSERKKKDKNKIAKVKAGSVRVKKGGSNRK